MLINNPKPVKLIVFPSSVVIAGIVPSIFTNKKISVAPNTFVFSFIYPNLNSVPISYSFVPSSRIKSAVALKKISFSVGLTLNKISFVLVIGGVDTFKKTIVGTFNLGYVFL